MAFDINVQGTFGAQVDTTTVTPVRLATLDMADFLSLGVPASEAVLAMTVTITAGLVGSYYSKIFRISVQLVSGTATVLYNDTVSEATSAWSVAVTTSGHTIHVDVTGAALTTISWVLNAQFSYGGYV